MNRNRYWLIPLSFIIVALGQPAWCWWCGLIASVAGYALFWTGMLALPTTKQRFFLSFCWASAVQLVHASWFISHPYWYIYPVWIAIAAFCGLQFALLSLLFNKEKIKSLPHLFLIAAFWTLLEWTRLHIVSGYSWNPIGIALSSHLLPLQTASLWGVYGMTFWVMIVNLLLLRSLVTTKKNYALVALLALLPYAYGYLHISYHDRYFARHHTNPDNILSALLVQPAFKPEEIVVFKDRRSAIRHVMDEWGQILSILGRHKDASVNLVVLPEYTVPYGTYSAIYPFEMMKDRFIAAFGPEVEKKLPPLQEPWASQTILDIEPIWFVNNAFMSQALANIFDADLIIGLEDSEYIAGNKKEIYSSAICFHCDGRDEERYEKRVLVPMGEYIPFEFCKNIAATYGITGSFTPGKGAKVFHVNNIEVGCCICYEETFGDMMRQNRVAGAKTLINLTSDVWYPDSKLTWQHYDHARLRTVENGIPLVRSCNTGITCVMDSLGREVASLKDEQGNFEWVADALKVDIPLYTYRTLYSQTGDGALIGFCLIISILGFRQYFK